VRYWVHTNMLTLNGQKMSRSVGNVFLPVELFTGRKLAADSPSATPSEAKLAEKHPLFEKGFSPMTVRFFMLQSHYSSTLDFSNDALLAAEKGFRKLMEAIRVMEKLQPSGKSTFDVPEFEQRCYEAMNDDFNTSVLLAELFDAVRIINSVADGREQLTATAIQKLQETVHTFVFDVLGLKDDILIAATSEVTDGLMQLIIRMRDQARAKKDFAASDLIRDELAKLQIVLKDGKEGTSWEIKS
ncbi:MAG TPA: DALR domain-containing protein, partial [Bacteroidia bacterium]|nr:DALR domain-containing protein [Bacteroidia bacterium]